MTLPVAMAAVGSATLFALLLAWDEFFYALLYTNDLRAKTLPVAIGDFASGRHHRLRPDLGCRRPRGAPAGDHRLCSADVR